MTISWVILTFNRAKMVNHSVAFNIANAGRKADELIHVDNGSTDNVREVMASFHPDKTVLLDKNYGVAVGYNRGFLEATCDYIVITGCDTEMPDGWLATFEKYLTLIPDTGVACIYCSPIEAVPERKRGELTQVNGLPIQPALPFGRRIVSRTLLMDDIGLLHEDLGLYGWEDNVWGERAITVCARKQLWCYSIPGEIANHMGSEGILASHNLKDDADYYWFKHREATDPAKQTKIAEIRRAGFPYYNPYKEKELALMQAKEQIEESYKTPDPWGFQSNPDDAQRKAKLLALLKPYGKFNRALDIGAGEGWITKDLNAKQIFGFEVSDTAASRFPPNVKRVLNPEDFKYDLIIATGVMYAQYDYQRFLDVIKKSATRIVLLSNIKDLEMPEVAKLGQQVHAEEFPYREYIQQVRIFDLSSKPVKDIPIVIIDGD